MRDSLSKQLAESRRTRCRVTVCSTEEWGDYGVKVVRAGTERAVT